MEPVETDNVFKLGNEKDTGTPINECGNSKGKASFPQQIMCLMTGGITFVSKKCPLLAKSYYTRNIGTSIANKLSLMLQGRSF